MAFIWANPATVTPGVTEAQAATMNEVQTNTDLLADYLTIAHYAWAELPVAVDEEITLIHLNELQDALDYIDDNNICTSQKTVHLGSYCGVYNVPHDAGIDASVCSTANGSYYSKN
jgi:hypothetical protein